ncbi:NnrT protein [Pseudorhodobacter sp.]|uniref:NnrT protein n=1 Tax=Pseudorhodobacter sp. TaxID=1934400 RepID=UPI00264A25BD|nr:NnrT protein [Pseudorhodobacter sp.]MDN5788437.1 NnrT protein [Pseudorhodobacter sp.]
MSNGPTLRLSLWLYPFGVGAVAVNLFFASLVGSWVGLPVLSPVQAVIGGLILGFPVAWPFARHIRRLMEKADN